MTENPQQPPWDAKKPPPSGDHEPPPKPKRYWWRFTLASVVIVGVTAAATATSILLYVGSIATALSHHNVYKDKLAHYLSQVHGGEPENILILGSDKRANMKGDPGRSDTTILLRLDPDRNAIAVMSIPRDLKVYIPGVRNRQVQRRLHLRRPEADPARRQAADRPADQPRGQRRLPRLRPRRQRDRLRLHRRRPPLLPLQPGPAPIRAVLGDRYPARLPAALRRAGAGVRALPPHRHRPGPLGAPAGLPQRRPPAGAGREAGLRRERRGRHLHPLHDLGHQRRGDDAPGAEAVHRLAQRGDP